MLQRSGSSSLELEALNYFKLNDPGQVRSFGHLAMAEATLGRRQDSERRRDSVYPRPKAAHQAVEESSSKAMHSCQAHNKTSKKYRNDLGIKVTGGNRLKPELDRKSVSKEIKNKQNYDTVKRQYEPAVFAVSPFLASSSTTSTNSLPSISSSPSVSPSLVCPHISLDDILSLRNDSRSAHTIGLCAKCRLNPPIDVQSPLSPCFKPSSTSKMSQSNQEVQRIGIRRGYSDQHMKPGAAGRSNGASTVRQSPRLLHRSQDDSLDHCLNPDELKRLQMSPSLRNSVEFIRKNQTEAGRVIVIHKNGQPFEKPLRICIMRGEFSTLNHLLDYINSRQLVPLGARYLFHMDGQLVYSVNELKHGSTYIVSGVRSFDFRSNNILREKLSKEVISPLQRDINIRRSQLSDQPLIQQKSVSHSEKLKSHSSNRKVPPIVQMKLPARGSSPVKREIDRKPYKKQESKIGTTRLLDRQEADAQKLPAFQDDDQSELTSKSTENLAASANFREKPVILVRAKSELGSGAKRKKNVTFVDTGRGSSPALEEFNQSLADRDVQASSVEDLSGSIALSASEVNLKEALSTNEIGIQVSDSIEGFLIDLPMPMPTSKEKPSKKSYLKKGEGSRASQRISSSKSPKPSTSFGGSSSKRATQVERVKPRRQVVTITERQLSLDEMNQLCDLNLGDHHHDASRAQPVVIKLDHVGDPPEESDEHESEAKQHTEPKVIETKPAAKDNKVKAEEKHKELEDKTQWQYPPERQVSVSPNERAVSQCEANESVHARVTTPTPSLSTVDNSSLTMSYEAGASVILQRGDSQAKQVDLPEKQRVPVRGRLCAGLYPPEKGFTLSWVNGFIINDLYPENSCSKSFGSGSKTPPPSSDKARLSPANSEHNLVSVFKASDRFNNWICHSRRHDELVYPVGSLVVLWCRWTNEQRYYSSHTSSVSSLALASLDDDLAASAQVGEASERSNTSVHLWSLTSLNTLFVIDDDLFYSRKIFSIRLKHNRSEGCEVSVGAKDDKHLWLYLLKVNLTPPDEPCELPIASKTTAKSNSISVIKVERLLQPNQVPLLVTRLSDQKLEAPLSSNKRQQNSEVVLSFGRRHFQLWSIDRKQRKMRLMQSESKSSRFINSIMKANCLVRLAPTEFLVGDADGNITLLMVSLRNQSEQKPLSSTLEQQKYRLETVHLLCSTADEIDSTDGDKQQTPVKPPSITCLARVSGNLFASGDSNCVVKFWRIERGRRSSVEGNGSSKTDLSAMSSSCRQVSCIKLPADLGFICTIVLSRYNRKQSIVDFYVVSTSNAILFGSVQLQVGSSNKDILANSSLSVVYEGHETSALNLVADCLRTSSKQKSISPTTGQVGDYFTCSIDCKICKWSGKNLVWKSMLPSACSSLAIHPTGFVLAVGAADGTVYIIDKYSGLLISYFPLTPVCINCLAYSRDGLLLAAGCANGSIFILPVYERGLKYKKVSIFQSPYPVVSLQFSLDNQFILTSVTHGSYQELILWDLPNFRYMRQGVKMAADKIEWFDPICSGSEDVRAIWENSNLFIQNTKEPQKARNLRRLTTSSISSTGSLAGTTVNLSCHRLIRVKDQVKDDEPSKENFVIASDTRGYLRMFCYPCYDIQQGFFEIRTSSSAINCCRFLDSTSDSEKSSSTVMFVSTSLDGSICLWNID